MPFEFRSLSLYTRGRSKNQPGDFRLWWRNTETATSEILMDKLIKTLPAILKASGAAPEVAEAACAAAWKHVVGEALSSHAVPIRLQDQTLVVAVADELWKRQLESMRGHLLFKLNSALGQALVKTLELRIDPRTIELERARRARTEKARSTDYQVPADLLNAAAGIADVDLRRAFLGAATSCVKRVEKAGG
jgi:hypothetical protein